MLLGEGAGRGWPELLCEPRLDPGGENVPFQPGDLIHLVPYGQRRSDAVALDPEDLLRRD
jgi:hypothetical protein